MSDSLISLVSKEGEEFPVEREFSRMCNLVKVTLEDNDEDTQIPLAMVCSKHIKWIIEFCRRHGFNELDPIKMPIPSGRLEDFVRDPKDIDFLNSLTLEEKCDLLQDCDYLNIPSLVELISAVIAAEFRGKEFEEIKDKYNIDKDFTPEEEENYKKEFSWMLETDGGNPEEFAKKIH